MRNHRIGLTAILLGALLATASAKPKDPLEEQVAKAVADINPKAEIRIDENRVYVDFGQRRDAKEISPTSYGLSISVMLTSYPYPYPARERINFSRPSHPFPNQGSKDVFVSMTPVPGGKYRLLTVVSAGKQADLMEAEKVYDALRAILLRVVDGTTEAESLFLRQGWKEPNVQPDGSILLGQ